MSEPTSDMIVNRVQESSLGEAVQTSETTEAMQLKRFAIRWARLRQGLFCVILFYAMSYYAGVSSFIKMRDTLSGTFFWGLLAWTCWCGLCLFLQVVVWWKIGRRSIGRSSLCGILLLSLLPCADVLHSDMALTVWILGARYALIFILLISMYSHKKESWWEIRPENSLQRLANYHVRFQSVLAVLAFLWGVAVVMNFPMLWGSWIAIQELTEIDRTIWLQFFETLLPMSITMLLVAWCVVWDAIASRSKSLESIRLSRGYRILFRCMIVAMMLPMLGDLLLFGAYFAYPIRVVLGITLLFWTRLPLFAEMMQLGCDVRKRG